ncbi:hypothetical protein [Vibrio ponticus]|nr:hypothetical protein [Vibrio ponticus]
MFSVTSGRGNSGAGFCMYTQVTLKETISHHEVTWVYDGKEGAMDG